MISARTKAALAVVKRNGSKSGRPIGNPGFLRVPSEIRARILELRSTGLSYRRVAETLNADQVPTVQGGKRWHGQTVMNIAKRVSDV